MLRSKVGTAGDAATSVMPTLIGMQVAKAYTGEQEFPIDALAWCVTINNSASMALTDEQLS